MRRFFCATAMVATTGVLAAQHAIKGEFHETLHAKLDPLLVSYKPAMTANGEIRSVGADTMEELTKLWIAGFTKVQTAATFTLEAKASGTAVAALTDGKADIGPCAREVLPPELGPFQKKFGYEPFAVRVASGSYRTPGKTDAIALLVNKENPIDKLTFSQLDAIFSTTRKRGGKEDIKTWGQLGLKGEWADKQISLWGLIRPNGIAQGTFDEVVAHTYPLSRYIYIYVNKVPNRPMEKSAKEFLDYVLSKEGQEAVVKEGIFLPLSASAVKQERAKLE